MSIYGLYIRPPGTNGLFFREKVSKVYCSYDGIVDSSEWHRSSDAIHEYGSVVQERSILIQSVENYNHLKKKFPKYFKENAPTFGENIIVKGIDINSISIGDIFEIEGSMSNLKLEVTSPRKPCVKIDKKHKSSYGLKGLRRYCLTNSLAGWFCRVLQEGTLDTNCRLIRTSCPHPKWTLTYLSKCLYGGGDFRVQARCLASWSIDKNVLQELCNIPQLAMCEWKEEALALLEKMSDHTQY